MAVRADYTPADVDLVLRRRSLAPIVVTFTATNFTGWVGPRILLGMSLTAVPTVIAGAVTTLSPDAVVTVEIDAAAWALIPSAMTAGVWHFEIVDPTGETRIMIAGKVKIEGSLT